MTITCPINTHQDYIGNRDLDSDLHKGFTVGKGKVMYWYITWHSTGSCTVYTSALDKKRWLNGNETITIHLL